jgi:hypothetical protein
MLVGELPTLPIGLCAAGDCSPVAAGRLRDFTFNRRVEVA